MKSFYTLFLCCFVATNTFSQTKSKNTFLQFGSSAEKHQAWELGVSNGLILYTGDINSATLFFKEIHPCFGAYTRYHFTDNMSLRGNLMYGQFTGNDFNYGAAHAGRNFIFRTNVWEVTSSMTWEPWGHKRYNSKDEKGRVISRISPYLHAGLGLVFLNPQVDFYEEGNLHLKDRIAIDKAHSPNYYLTIPFGSGFRYDVSPQWTITAEGSFRVPFTDYLDGISQAANPLKGDWYGVGTVSLGYRFKYKKDRDHDNIPDDTDLCPDLPGLPTSNGCPDRDNDGVLDKNDTCPDEKGSTELKGCPDQDNDGVADYEDHCPFNAGLKKMHGCPDRDKDGVVDYKDLCPDLVGTITTRGCPDKDGDGVMDKQDKCPTEKGLLAAEGCPSKDYDNDGVPDYADACPDKPGGKENNGCPQNPPISKEKVVGTIVRKDPNNFAETKNDSTKVAQIQNAYYTETKSVLVKAQNVVDFVENATKLKDVSYAGLNSIVEVLSKDSGARIEINVHNVDTKYPILNKKLAEARARTLYYFFIKNGIVPERLRYVGIGDSEWTKEVNQEEAKGRKVAVRFKIF